MVVGGDGVAEGGGEVERWTYPLVPGIPEFSDADVKADAKGECAYEDSAHVDTCSFEKVREG